MLVYNGIEIDLYGELTETNGLLSKKKKLKLTDFIIDIVKTKLYLGVRCFASNLLIEWIPLKSQLSYPSKTNLLILYSRWE